MSHFKITLYMERQFRWVVAYPQRHFSTHLGGGHVYQLDMFFSTFKDGVAFAQQYMAEYPEWKDIPFTYYSNNGGVKEVHDLRDDATLMYYILKHAE